MVVAFEDAYHDTHIYPHGLWRSKLRCGVRLSPLQGFISPINKVTQGVALGYLL